MTARLFAVALLSMPWGLTAYSGEEDLKPSLIGTWHKLRTREEDHGLPGDRDWQLEVTFSSDGRFVWKSGRTEPDGTRVDDSLTGRWRVLGRTITYTFDTPSEAAAKRIPKLFAYWPSQNLGRHTVGFRNDSLVLGHDGGKIWIELRKKSGAGPPTVADPATHGAAEP